MLWGFRRYMKESRRYMAHLPWYIFYPEALMRWPVFNELQKRDFEEALRDVLRH